MLLLVRYSFGGLLLLVRYSFGGGAATRPLLVRWVAATRPLLVRRRCCYSSATRSAGVLLLVRYSSAGGARVMVRCSCSYVLYPTPPWVFVVAMCSCHSAVLVPRACSLVEHWQAPLVLVAVLLRMLVPLSALTLERALEGARAHER